MVHENNEISSSLHSNSQNDKPKVFERKQIPYVDLSEQFTQVKTDFSKQFAHVYAARIEELRTVLFKTVTQKWEGVQILKLSELADHKGERCILIGTLFKHQQWKPSILRELSDDHQLITPPPRADYCSEKDQSYLEDETLRIRLTGDCVDTKHIVTGVVCAVLGNENKDGIFSVEDWCFPGCLPQVIREKPNVDGKLILLSGLDFAKSSESLALSLLMEWICGMAGNVTAQEEEAAVARVIIAGNTFKSHSEVYTGRGHSQGKAHEAAIMKEYLAATQKMDHFLTELSQCCCVSIMPGPCDPANVMMPQKPFHPCLVPKASRFESFKSVGNPWMGKIGDRIILGTSGQPIEDIMKVSGVTDVSPLTWLEKSLVWRHLCPTAPDTLPAYPFHEKDLFIMKECPDVYFVGNMTEYETKLWKGEENQVVRLICIPKFSTSHTAVLVDLKTLDTQYISFGTD